MGVTNTGARNSVGLHHSVWHGHLPPHTHISYEGVFNELRYNVGPKTDKILDLHHAYARFQFAQSKFDSDIHDYLALFIKGKDDGQPRDPNRRLNSIICLDISGSMNCFLCANQNHQTRINLSIQAIKMFISKLQPEDSVGMTTFDTQAHLIFEPTLKKNINQQIYQKLDSIKANGGNTLIDGFKMSRDLLMKQMKNQTQGHIYENRVVILSDVCDNSITQSLQVIKDAANNDNIHLTIVGISTDFQSQTCEELKDTKGFNYFCAVNNEDILKYLFQTFDYTFFPSASDMIITLQSDNVVNVESFGTPKDLKQHPYAEEQTTKGNSFILAQSQSCFPSQIQIENNDVYTVGGLILVKIQRKTKTPIFEGKISLSYKDLYGKNYVEKYDVKYEFHPQQQFLSDQILKTALQGFSFTSQLKNILQKSQKMQKKQIYQTYYEMLVSLQGLCPKSKHIEYKTIRDVIKGYEPQKQEQEPVDSKQEAKLQEVKVSQHQSAK